MAHTGNFRNLTNNQLEVFEQIAVNNDAAHNQKTLDSLVNKGLIEKYSESGIDEICAFSITRYRVPINVHMEWADWCMAYKR